MRANINDHGAWIYIVWNGSYHQVRGKDGNTVTVQETEQQAFATVDAAAKFMHTKLVASGEVDLDEFEGWVACLAANTPGCIDCYHSCYPVVWYDPAKDDGQFEVEDFREWEDALRRRKLEAA